MENNHQITEIMKSEIPTIERLIGLNAKAGVDTNALAIQEVQFLQMQMVAKPWIAKCDKTSIILALKYAIKNNLSLDPNAGLIYLTPLSVKTKDAEGRDKWIDTLEIKPTAEGKLSIAYQCSTILDHKRPKAIKDASGKVIGASVEVLLPSIPNPRWELVEMDLSDFKRLRVFSHNKNSRGKDDAATRDYSNPLYSSFNGGIDPEFACAKVVSLALKKRGSNMAARSADRIYSSLASPTPADQPSRSKEVVPMTQTEDVPYTEVTNANQATTETAMRSSAATLPDAKDL